MLLLRYVLVEYLGLPCLLVGSGFLAGSVWASLWTHAFVFFAVVCQLAHTTASKMREPLVLGRHDKSVMRWATTSFKPLT